MRQTSCKHCGHDIEGAGRDWRDRGNDDQCPEFCGYDQDGNEVNKPRRKHEPYPLHDTDEKLPTRHYQKGRYGYVERLTQPR